jgi:hypothetical protein
MVIRYGIIRYCQFDSITFDKRETVISYGIIRYSHFDSNTFDKRETVIRCGIIRYSHINIRITFDKEKRRHVCCFQVFSLIFELPSTKRNENMYDVSGIIINIRITFDKEKRRHV